MSDVIESPVTDDAAPPIVEEAAPVLDETPTAELDQESDTLEIPDSTEEGGKAVYVPRSALLGTKKELGALKAELAVAREGSAKADRLEQQIAQMQQQLNAALPLAQAYQAAIQQQPQHEAGPSPEERANLEEIARDFEFYKTDGTLDLDKAARAQARTRTEAARIAKQEVAPIHQQTEAQASDYNMKRALNTEIHGVKADPEIVRALWARVPKATSATEEGAKHLLIQALGMTTLSGKAPARAADGKFVPAAAADIPAPLHTEKAGGRDTPAQSALSTQEKQYCKDVGMSEADYMKSAQSAPWLRK